MKKINILVMLTIMILFFVACSNSESIEESEQLTSNKESQLESTPVPNIAPTIEPTPNVVQEYKSGDYEVGVDIPAGRYMLYLETSTLGDFYLSKDANFEENSTQIGHWGNNSIIEVIEGEYLRLDGVYAVSYNQSQPLTLENGYFEAGEYIVGEHIPAGTYKLEATIEDKLGFYVVYNNVRRENEVIDSNIKSIDHVELEDGQLLFMMQCRILVEDDSKNTKDITLYDNTNFSQTINEFAKNFNDYINNTYNEEISFKYQNGSEYLFYKLEHENFVSPGFSFVAGEYGSNEINEGFNKITVGGVIPEGGEEDFAISAQLIIEYIDGSISDIMEAEEFYKILFDNASINGSHEIESDGLVYSLTFNSETSFFILSITPASLSESID